MTSMIEVCRCKLQIAIELLLVVASQNSSEIKRDNLKVNLVHDGQQRGRNRTVI